MIKIEGTNITITRGDCEPFTITLTGEDVPADGEKVLFSVKKTQFQDRPEIKKILEVINSQIVVQINNSDTRNLEFGNYLWDIRFPNYYGENEPYTPMSPAVFTIAEVIGNV